MTGTQANTPKDEVRINICDEAQLRYWAKELRAAPATIKDAVRIVGPIAIDVRKRLRKHPRGLNLRGR